MLSSSSLMWVQRVRRSNVFALCLLENIESLYILVNRKGRFFEEQILKFQTFLFSGYFAP